MTATVEAGARVVEVFPSANEVAVVELPAGVVAIVHHPGGERREYSDPGQAQILVVPGDREAICWGWAYGWYGSLRGVRNGHRPMNRPAWHEAARAVQSGAQVAYVQYETRDYHGKPTWTAIGVRVEDGETR